MKKQEKIDLIKKGIDEKLICRCYFTYDENYYYYPNAVNDKFILGQEEDDFILDGYSIRKISHLKKVQIKDDKCGEINKLLGITEQICDPGIDISSWKSIFEDLSKLDVYLIIENEITGEFAIGKIEKVLKNKLYFQPFDADGVWDEDGLEIPYSKITTVTWNCRYAKYWKMYLEREEEMK